MKEVEENVEKQKYREALKVIEQTIDVCETKLRTDIKALANEELMSMLDEPILASKADADLLKSMLGEELTTEVCEYIDEKPIVKNELISGHFKLNVLVK